MKINVRIKPNSKKGPLISHQPDGSLVVFIREPALEGKANQALVKILADHFDVPQNNISIITGLTSRHKNIEIDE